MNNHPAFITVSHGMSGYFAVYMTWSDDDDGGFYEPWQTGIGRYVDRESAVMEATAWATDEGMEYRD